MPTFYFDIAQGDIVEEDNKGAHAADERAAREIAARSVMELLREVGKAMTGAVIEIRDENRKLVATVPVNLAALESTSGSIH